jgi:dipeptidyl aminopeptidase/acylaminoacyl peptidase
MKRSISFVSATVLALVSMPVSAQEAYRLPPQDVVDILDAPPPPSVVVSPDHEWLVLAHRKSMPSIADMAQPMLRIGGRRINPMTNGSFSPPLTTGYSILRVSDGSERQVDLPYQDGWGSPDVSPDGSVFFTTRTTEEGIELWVGDLAAASARRLLGPMLNGARGGACSWMPDSESLLCHAVLEGRGSPPEAPTVPAGPVVQENLGLVAPVRTYQDLLENPHDEALYDYYMTSQPMLVDVSSGNVTSIGVAGVYAGLSVSPSGEYLLAERRERPYSYLVTDRSFPMDVEVWDRSGEVVARVADVPLRETVPIGGVESGPRNFDWMRGEDHTLVYVQALDGGDTRSPADVRDRVMLLDAPFAEAGRELIRTQYRYAGMGRGEGDLVLVYESDRSSRMRRTWKIDVSGEESAVLLFERSTEDRYGDPGSPITSTDTRGDRIIVQDGDWIFLSGPGGSDDGDRPFLDRFNIETGETERLWRAEVGTYEDILALLDDTGARVLTQRQTPTDFPNYFIRDMGSGSAEQITFFDDPHPELSAVSKQLITYEREDGVQLSGTLYLPPGFTEGDVVPAVVWAYPREYANEDLAGQVRGSPYRFTRITGYSHLFFLTQGYAVLDGATIPIVGGDVANDTYVEQLVSSAQAAVDVLVERGISQADKIGVGGHSYGAFMTANLLAHSDIFAAGIARSGAYNRTLTPFGFQSEQRTFWEAPDLYFEMSPFMHADKINEPMLMIHGIADNNSGTFPVQSERMYHALKGHGATVRLVMLPHESHGYRARESVMTALAEMIEWFDTYVRRGRDITF